MQRGLLVAVAAALAVPVVVNAQVRASDEQRRRDQIQLMEGVLSRAVRLGAEQVNRRMQSIDPTISVITGQARARGFVLEGYGVFFDVEVPPMSASAVWSMMTVQRDVQVAASLDSLRRAIAALPEGPKLQEAQQALQRVARQVGPLQPQGRDGSDVGPVPANTVVAATTAPVMDDPDRQYADAVKSALIDAMLDHSLSMDLGPDEWLTVAARESDGILAQNQLYDVTTIVLRVKGSDLAAYMVDRTKRADVRQKVDVRVF
ncbi:MAG TPA: hypothetical protein VM032_10425 [Vicinamibacterales bacterium]|nr:hypothetical protein [Vicinamibacterales bacterium]